MTLPHNYLRLRRIRPKGFPNLLVVCPSPTRERLIVRALEEAVARFNSTHKIQGLPFFITSSELLLDPGIMDRVWAPSPTLDDSVPHPGR